MFIHRKKLAIALAALFIVGSGATVLVRDHNAVASNVAAAAAPVVEVDVANVVSKSITEWQNYSGRLEAIDKVEIRPLVPGRIVAVHFKDGAMVKKGDLLFTIDPRPYVAEVDRAAAQLAAAEARSGYASSDAARADRLLEGNAIAKRDYEEKHNAAREANANLKAAKAALEVAKVNLAYTDITAPVAGRVSRAELTLGNIVSNGANAPLLTTLVSVSPIYASFDVDEQTYLRYLRHESGASVPVSLGLADESDYSRNGTVVSIDNRLDTSSGTIRVRARFDNAEGSLLPGLFARVKVGGSKPHVAVMVNDAVIGTDQAKKYVLTIDKANRVHYQEVTLGNLHDGLRIITTGLKPEDRVIVNGMQRVKPDDSVQPRAVDMTDMNSVGKTAA